MLILDEIKIGKTLPVHAEYDALTIQRDFWRRTYDTPIDYLYGSDALGNPIIPRHACEKAEDYNQRLRITKPKTIASDIIAQYHSFLYQEEPERQGIPDELLLDADLYGTGWNELIKEAVLNAQVAGAHILIPDTTSPMEPLSVAQARLNGVRPYVSSMPIETMINWSKKHNSLLEAIMLFDNDSARYYNSDFYVDISIVKNNRNNYKIVSVSEPVIHGYETVPLVVLRPTLWKGSQIARLAELQQTVFNLDSILQMELQNHTFTHWVMTGDFDIEELKNVKFGQGQVTVLTTSANGVTPTMNRLGSETSQADSLRSSIKEEISAIYRSAGLSSPEPLKTAAPESGVAKLVEFSRTNSIVKNIADAAEAAENRLLALLSINATVNYADSFDSLQSSY